MCIKNIEEVELQKNEKEYNLQPDENDSTNNSIEKTPVSKETKQIQKDFC